MKVLVLGGSGAMGAPLLNYLRNYGYQVHATSRVKRENDGICWHTGNAHEAPFLSELLTNKFDVVIDFMAYTTSEFQQVSSIILPETGHYLFTSSARVYAYSPSPLTENSPRLLDVCKDQDYLKTDEYALSKARQENILIESKSKNWTIIRPSLTYNDERMQYVMGEKEVWLYRALIGKKVVFPKNLTDITTTMSHGEDVAFAVSKLVGNQKALRETVHIAGGEPLTWGKVNDIYRNTLLKKTKAELDFFEVDDWKKVCRYLNYYQMKYARAISRTFDNAKLYELTGAVPFRSAEKGLSECLTNFLNHHSAFRNISWKSEAIFDRITGDFGHFQYFTSKEKIKYIIVRFAPELSKLKQ